VLGIKYLSELYTFKVPYLDGRSPVVADPSTPLEAQIQAWVVQGNQLYLQEKYASALTSYLTAWGMIPCLIDRRFAAEISLLNTQLLLKADFTNELIAASVEIHQYRDGLGSGAPLGGPGDPPPELQEISKEFSSVVASPAERRFERGLAFAQGGQLKQAQVELQQALRLAQQDGSLQLDIQGALAAVTAAQGNYSAAQQQFDALSGQHTQAGNGDKAAAMLHNAGVAQTLSGDIAGASERFVKSSTLNPSGLNWTVTHSANPGISAFQRPLGAQGLPLLAFDGKGKWVEIPPSHSVTAKTSVAVLKDGHSIQIDLTANPESAIRTQLFEPRVHAVTLSALETYYWYLPQFVSYLTHVSGFILPLAIGDAYSQLGDFASASNFYLRVRDYAYLNQPIERPMVWTRLARTYLRLGNRLYRDRDLAGARVQYENIVQMLGGAFVLSGPLYNGGFAVLQAETLAFLNAPDKLAFTGLDYARRAIILEALANLNQILNNINYLGFPDDIVPIQSWRYLQNIARYMANQAIQMERNYINFKNTAQQEQATRLSLEQSVDAAQAATAVEVERMKAAHDQLNVAKLSATAAQNRLDNATGRKIDYANTSKDLAVLDEISAWATGPMDKAEVDAAWAGALGLSPGEYDTYQVTRFASRARSKISRDYELRNMDRQIADMNDAKAIANAQVTAANSVVAVAQAQKELADLKQQQAQSLLDNFNAQEFTPELWNNLAEAQRELSQRYLDRAIGAAFLMERAFEFEYDLEVNRIRFDYSQSQLHGLLAGDFLLADIDEFTYDRLLDTQKKAPVKVVIPLADRYPFQFFQQFQKTGHLEFDTLLEDFDRTHPGAHLRKLRRVEVVVEGLIPREGAQGFLHNSGFSYFRGRDGLRKLRVQKPETALLSLYDVRRDGFVFTTEEGLLQLFENSGPATGWTLAFPPDSNNIDYRTISNINLVLYFDAYYSDSVSNMARAELEAGAIYKQTLGLALRFQFPDEFFNLQDARQVVFAVGDNYVPSNQLNPRILDAQIVVVTDDGVSSAGLVTNVQSANGGLNLNQSTDANGIIATGTGTEALNTVRGQPLVDSWTIGFDATANAAAVAAGFGWNKISNIFLNIEYEYSPRGREPIADDFSINPIATFDIVDDPAATGSPSTWGFSPNFDGSVLQTSSIGGGTLTDSPEKPGTYLVRKTSAQWADLRDLCLRCHLRSSNNGGIGVVFRYQDVSNFYFFLMDPQRNYRRIGKKVGGVFQELALPAFENVTPGYQLNQTYEVSVAAVGDAFSVALDGVHILSGRDSSIQAPGRVGLFSWGNNGSSFLDLSVRPA
jgi:hypothetical protein